MDVCRPVFGGALHRIQYLLQHRLGPGLGLVGSTYQHRWRTMGRGVLFHVPEQPAPLAHRDDLGKIPVCFWISYRGLCSYGLHCGRMCGNYAVLLFYLPGAMFGDAQTLCCGGVLLVCHSGRTISLVQRLLFGFVWHIVPNFNGVSLFQAEKDRAGEALGQNCRNCRWLHWLLYETPVHHSCDWNPLRRADSAAYAEKCPSGGDTCGTDSNGSVDFQVDRMFAYLVV